MRNERRPSTVTPKQKAALALREPAWQLVRLRGRFQNVHPGLQMPYYEGNGFKMLLRTPFNSLPEFAKTPQNAWMDGSTPEVLNHGLDIWFEGPKVLNIERDTDGRFDIARFNRGSWEEQLIKLAKECEM